MLAGLDNANRSLKVFSSQQVCHLSWRSFQIKTSFVILKETETGMYKQREAGEEEEEGGQKRPGGTVTVGDMYFSDDDEENTTPVYRHRCPRCTVVSRLGQFSFRCESSFPD